MSRYRPLLLLPLLLTVPSPRVARATVLRGLDLPTLCRQSDAILRGYIVRTRAAWRGGRILTAVTLRVEHTLAGTAHPGDSVIFYRLGGEVGGLGQRVLGAPRFRVGEHVLLFLRRLGAHRFVTGMVQGKLRILDATRDQPTRIVSAAARFPLRGPHRALTTSTPLASFEARVRALLPKSARRPGRRP